MVRHLMLVSSPIPTMALEKVQRILDRLDKVRDGEAPGIWYANCPVIHDEPFSELRVFLNKTHTRIHAKCNAGCTERTIREALEFGAADFFVGVTGSLLERMERNEERSPTMLPQATCALYAPPAQPLEWAVDRLFLAGEIGLLVGDGGSFKSTAALAIGAAVAGGYPVWGHFKAPQRPVLIVSGEDSQDVIDMRLNALVEGHGWDKAATLMNVHYLAFPGDVSLSDEKWKVHIAHEAKRLNVGLIVLDPLCDLFEGDENSNSEMRPVMQFCRSLAHTTNAAVLVIHHMGKAGENKRDIDRIRGASRLYGAARSVLFFDYHATGVSVKHLKCNRAPKLPTFVLGRRILSDRDNVAVWTSATLTYHDAHGLALSKAESFVMTQVSCSPGITSTTLRSASDKTPGISRVDVAEAVKTLQSRSQIRFEQAPNNEKHWYTNDAA